MFRGIRKLPRVKKENKVLCIYKRPRENHRNYCANMLTTYLISRKRKTICFKGCRVELVRRIASEKGFEVVHENDIWNIMWSGCPLPVSKAAEHRRNMESFKWGKRTPPTQKVNHFPGISEICRKDRLARNLKRLKNIYPKDFNFFPRTYCLPSDWTELQRSRQKRGNEIYICKPGASSQGKGIFLTKNVTSLDPLMHFICQKYITKPLLINGLKFDLRIYVLITSCNPLRIYIYKDGIARFATIEYEYPNEKNIMKKYMHLTNFSVNKHNEENKTAETKRKMSTVLKAMTNNGYDVDHLMSEIDGIIVKTIISIQPTLKHLYRISYPNKSGPSACFEILGFDILIERRKMGNLKPYLIEVNHSPSFSIDKPVDKEVKEKLIRDTFSILLFNNNNLQVERKALLHSASSERLVIEKNDQELTCEDFGVSRALLAQFEHEEQHGGNFRLIYPPPKDQIHRYSHLFDHRKCPSFLETNTRVSNVQPVMKETKALQFQHGIHGHFKMHTKPDYKLRSTKLTRVKTIMSVTVTNPKKKLIQHIQNNKFTLAHAVLRRNSHLSRFKMEKELRAKSLKHATLDSEDKFDIVQSSDNLSEENKSVECLDDELKFSNDSPNDSDKELSEMDKETAHMIFFSKAALLKIQQASSGHVACETPYSSVPSTLNSQDVGFEEGGGDEVKDKDAETKKILWMNSPSCSHSNIFPLKKSFEEEFPPHINFAKIIKSVVKHKINCMKKFQNF